MEGKPCERHDEQLKALFRKHESTKIDIGKLETRVDDVNDIKTSLSTLSLSMDYMVKHNEKQDAMHEKKDAKREKTNERLNGTLERMSINLSELNEGRRSDRVEMQTLNNRQGTTEEDVRCIKESQMINTAQLITNMIIRVIIPAGVAGAIISIAFKFIE